MEKKYDPKVVEPKIQKFWADNDIFKFDPKSKKPIFSIDTPPPTISGFLHMGHAYSYSQAEFIARFWRMRGYNVFYPMGFDNNGLATEILTEKNQNVRAEKMTREEFRKTVLKVTENFEKEYENVWRKIGISVDWSLLYRTNSLEVRKISQRSFIELYKMGRAYRIETPSLWCPKCHTSLAQSELEDRDIESSFNYIKFKLEDKGEILIATTRPELLSSCVSIFVSPEDKKNSKLIGKKATVPIFGHKVTIMSDYRVDPEKGTGIVMCCTFGDQTDLEWFKAHKLPLKMSIDERGVMTELAGKYKGLPIKKAREEIIKDLEKEGLITKKEKINHTVNVHERCGTEIEFYACKQWFIKYLDLKDKFLQQAEKVKWHPDYMKVRHTNWVNGLQWDWSISRQRYYGVPFPVWYCKKCGEPYVAGEKEIPVDPLVDKPKGKCKCGSSDFEPEKDILDTWATSSITPQINAKWGEKNSLMDKIYPMSLRAQAHDIITTWAFYTIAKSYLHSNSIPWNNIMISGHGLDPKGDKMSKSKGNVVLPLDVVEKYSADAMRWWSSSAKLGEDLTYQEKDVATGQKILNKLWNSSLFVNMNLDAEVKKPKALRTIDKWILSKLMGVIDRSTKEFEQYEYSRAKQNTEMFFWREFCDNYIELIKHRLYGGKEKDSAQWTAYYCLLNIVKLFSPIIPHVTEEIYQEMLKKTEKDVSINLSKWPEVQKELVDKEAEECGDMAIKILAALRQWKQQSNMALNAELKSVTIDCDKDIKKKLDQVIDDVKEAMKVKEIKFGKANTAIEGTSIKFDVSA